MISFALEVIETGEFQKTFGAYCESRVITVAQFRVAVRDVGPLSRLFTGLCGVKWGS